MMVTLTAQKRADKLSRKALKTEGKIPAVFYGFNSETTPISIEEGAFKKIWEESGESGTVSLSLDGGDTVDTLIHDVQRDPVTNQPIHVDFLVIDTTKPVSIHIPIEFDGISEAVKTGLGGLVKVMHEVEIEALPKNLPHALHANLELLKTLEDKITAADLSLPEGVTLLAKADSIVALVEPEHEEVVDEGPADLSSIEVVGKKADEESEEGSGEEKGE